MSHLDFLCPGLAAPDAAWRSPLARALEHAGAPVDDLSRTGVLEARGDLDGLDAAAAGAEVVRLTPARALVLCAFEEAAGLGERLAGDGRLVVDVSAGWAGLRVRGETAMRRLTDLDLGALPAVGSVAHVRALVLRDEGYAFRIFFGQEYGDYLVEVVADALAGVSAS